MAVLQCNCTAAHHYILIHTPKDPKKVRPAPDIFWSDPFLNILHSTVTNNCTFRSTIRSQYVHSIILTGLTWTLLSYERNSMFFFLLSKSSATKSKITCFLFNVCSNHAVSLWLLWCVFSGESVFPLSVVETPPQTQILSQEL